MIAKSPPSELLMEPAESRFYWFNDPAHIRCGLANVYSIYESFINDKFVTIDTRSSRETEDLRHHDETLFR